MQKEKNNLCIATLDPTNKGGVLSMAEFVYFRAKDKYNPSLVYNLLPGFRPDAIDLSFFQYIFGSRAKINKEVSFGMSGVGIQRVSPMFEFFNYLLNLGGWRKALDECDIFFAAGGSNNSAIPFALLNKDFSLWVASTLYEDRVDRIKNEPILRKARDLVALPFLLILEKYVYKKARKIMTVSNYTKKYVTKKYPFVADKIETAYFPIDTDYFKPAQAAKDRGKYILFTGRIADDRKNIQLLIKAFSRLPKEYGEISLKLIGGDPSREVVALCADLGVSSRVEFPAYMAREALLSAYQNAFLFIIPSLQEGLCISGLESMACGVPVISTKCGGPEDFVKDGVNGFLCENNDADDLLSKLLLYLALEDEERAEMGAEARKYVVANHNQDKVWKQIEDSLIN